MEEGTVGDVTPGKAWALGGVVGIVLVSEMVARKRGNDYLDDDLLKEEMGGCYRWDRGYGMLEERDWSPNLYPLQGGSAKIHARARSRIISS